MLTLRPSALARAVLLATTLLLVAPAAPVGAAPSAGDADAARRSRECTVKATLPDFRIDQFNYGTATARGIVRCRHRHESIAVYVKTTYRRNPWSTPTSNTPTARETCVDKRRCHAQNHRSHQPPAGIYCAIVRFEARGGDRHGRDQRCETFG